LDLGSLHQRSVWRAGAQNDATAQVILDDRNSNLAIAALSFARTLLIRSRKCEPSGTTDRPRRPAPPRSATDRSSKP
jgi:hypothetical protein